MRPSIEKLLDDAQKKMSGYAALFNYRLHNLNIKADPEALLSISVVVGGEELPIEEVALARIADGREDQFEIYPRDKEYLFPIVRGIKESHPEYELDFRNILEDESIPDEENEKLIVATMPVVNDDRHDILTQGVKTLSDVCKGQLDITISRYTAEITLKLANAPAEELDEAKDALQQLRDKHDELVQQFREDKENEIEEAYAAWQAAQAEKEAKQQEEEAAHNALAGLQMKMNPDEEDE